MASRSTRKPDRSRSRKATASRAKAAPKRAGATGKPATKTPAHQRPAKKRPASPKKTRPTAASESRPPRAEPAVPTAPSIEAQRQGLALIKAWFDRSTACLAEEDSEYAPAHGAFTAAHHVAHAAQTVDWFLEGAFRPEGFGMDFADMEERVRRIRSLAEARAWWDAACARLDEALRTRAASAWSERIAAGTIMGGEPRHAIIEALTDHTAHHRGALTVYARLRGKTPAMPYAGG